MRLRCRILGLSLARVGLGGGLRRGAVRGLGRATHAAAAQTERQNRDTEQDYPDHSSPTVQYPIRVRQNLPRTNCTLDIAWFSNICKSITAYSADSVARVGRSSNG